MDFFEPSTCNLHGNNIDGFTTNCNCIANVAYHYGRLFEARLGSEPDYYKAFLCYKQAASYGHTDAQYRAALILYFGHAKVKNDFAESLRLFQASIDNQKYSEQSNSNKANAYYYMAMIYYHGLGVEKDLKKAFQLFKISAEQGQPKAQCQLGQMYCAQKKHALAFVLFKKAANQGDPVAQNNLAVYYFEGRVSPPDPKKALFWLIKAVKHRNPIIQLNIGQAFCQGLEGYPDYANALYYMELSGLQRYSKAQYEVGLCHLYGRGTKKDTKQAIIWLKKAVNNDKNPAALYTLGLIYMKGLGVKINNNAAFEYSMRSAQQGYSEGQTQLGLCYLNGIGTTKDLKKAKECFEEAAHNDNNSAGQYYLGCLYFTGQGVKVNRELAFYWYLQSAFQGFPDAQNAVGECYMNGQGTRQDYEKSLFWFESSISLNKNAVSQYNLGLMYYYGLGVEVDYKYAFNCFIRSSEKGYSDAENQVGHCYRYGRGPEQDFRRAMYWYRKSLENNDNASAQYSIGKMYLNGLGVGKDLELAFYCFEKSAKQGYSNGQYMLGKCYEEGQGTLQNYKQAMSSYQDAVDNDNNAKAQYSIGCLYNCGYGVTKSRNLSQFWFQQSADQGFSKALLEVLNYCCGKNPESDSKTFSKLELLQRDKASIKPMSFPTNEELANYIEAASFIEAGSTNVNEELEPENYTHVVGNSSPINSSTSTSISGSACSSSNISSDVLIKTEQDVDKFFHVDDIFAETINAEHTSNSGINP